MHEVKRITTIKKNQPLSSLGDLFTGMRYKTLQWAQTLVSRVTGLSSPPFPLYPLSLRAAAQPFPVPFVPSVSRPLGEHWPLCPLHSTVSQAHHRAATGSGGTTASNRLYCSYQHLNRLYLTSQEEQDNMPGETTCTWAVMKRVYNVIFTVTSQNTK